MVIKNEEACDFWEDRIFDRQEAREAAEDCSGYCAGCIFAGECDSYQEDDLFK